VTVSEKAAFSEKSEQTGFSENTIGALSYITFVPALYFLIIPRYNKSSYVRFHAWQSILLDVVAFLVSMILSALVLPAMKSQSSAIFVLDVIRVMWGVWFGLWIVTAIAALKGHRFRIWIIGNLSERQAAG
jgi:uncharacterized membrane protein